MYDDSSGCAAVMLVPLIALLLLFGYFGPGFGIEALDTWPDTSDGAVVVVQGAEYTGPSQVTTGGNTLVVMLSGFWAAVGELFAVLCGGGLITWGVAIVLVFLGIAGIGAAAG